MKHNYLNYSLAAFNLVSTTTAEVLNWHILVHVLTIQQNPKHFQHFPCDVNVHFISMMLQHVYLHVLHETVVCADVHNSVYLTCGKILQRWVWWANFMSFCYIFIWPSAYQKPLPEGIEKVLGAFF